MLGGKEKKNEGWGAAEVHEFVEKRMSKMQGGKEKKWGGGWQVCVTLGFS